MAAPIFNSYDEHGWRVNCAGYRSYRTTDENILRNLRFRWPELLAQMSDTDVVNAYDDFVANCDEPGDNDANFPQWLETL